MAKREEEEKKTKEPKAARLLAAEICEAGAHLNIASSLIYIVHSQWRAMRWHGACSILMQLRI